jgi:hypothetical protein
MYLYDVYSYFEVKFPEERGLAWRKSSKPLKFFLSENLDEEGTQKLDFCLHDLGCKRWLNYTVTGRTGGKLYFSATYAEELGVFYFFFGSKGGSVVQSHAEEYKFFDRVEDQVVGLISWYIEYEGF